MPLPGKQRAKAKFVRDKGTGTPFLPSLTCLSWFEPGKERGILVAAYLGEQAEHTRQLKDHGEFWLTNMTLQNLLKSKK